MKKLILLMSILFSLPLLATPCPQDGPSIEALEQIMDGVTPVVNYYNDCKSRTGITEGYVRELDENPTWPEALIDNPIDCIKGIFQGLRDSVVDIAKFFWSLAKTFFKALDATMQTTYSFLKAAFTGNLSYWFSEASNGAMDFIENLFNSIKAIPKALGKFFSEKVDDWHCMSAAGQSNYACKMVGYIGGDALITALTLGAAKGAWVGKITQKVKKTLGAKQRKKTRNIFEDPKNPLNHLPQRDLKKLIPDNVRDRRFVVEVDSSGHYSVRYFDKDGVPQTFDGAPFFHYFTSKRLRRQGIGKNRVRARGGLRKGEHFTVDVPPEKFQDLMDHIGKTKGSFSLACTRTACESMKAAGLDLNQKAIPSIDKLYTRMIQESYTNPAVKRQPVNLTIPEQHLVVDRFKRNTNIVRFNFGATAVAGYLYGTAAAGTAPMFIIDSMSSHIPPNSDKLDDLPP